ncbi:3-deoxy-D-manno-octulosonic acid transferase [Winogradskyella algicola]|uniref:3-deoxy-D-manno-octulosonic acid transferase n=1 Tax=Winogradskyella algicola TaxID=2575815 RepID=UPI001109B2CC|nr:glycosyltransferase N-terminal domain-containing protein [Winogradskyella algicola]
MRLLYTTVIHFAGLVIKLLALFNSKLKQGVDGRKETFKNLKSSITDNDKTFWFHCASLGEYEQGLPVFEQLVKKHPDFKVVLSFFSPSGYEVRKNSKIADIVVYLPLDTKKNAKRFLDIVKPNYTIFVKYEIWPNFLLELKKRNHRAILISAIFRKNQAFFKWYGNFMTSALFAFNHIFTQNEDSKILLERINYKNVSVSGDTRFDRVSNQLKIDNSVDFIEKFKQDNLCIVFGSTWPEDDKLYMDYINQLDFNDIKVVIAPHNIKSGYIESLKSQIKSKSICFSELSNEKKLLSYNVFILDTIGYLSRVYSYADIVYVGGAAGTTGLHNILEPAVFGSPIIIGKNYNKFPEAIALIELDGVTSVSNSTEFKSTLDALISNSSLREKQGQVNKKYVKKNTGAVIQILDYIRIS